MSTDDTILHQTDVEDVIDAQIDEADDDYARVGTGTIASPTAPGSSYSQAEAASMKTAVDAIRAALTAAGITA